MDDSLVLAGRRVEGAADRIRRYCGLSWSGGQPETWAYRYYDAIDSDPTRVGPVDVLAAAALHPGLGRADLAWFHENGDRLASWLDRIPVSADLATTEDALVRRLHEVPHWPEAPTVTLLSKVLHRKRPALIPLVDRHIIDWYRPVTGQRTAAAAWGPLLAVLGDDLRANTVTLDGLVDTVAAGTGQRPTPLRLVDISLWMADR